MEQTRKFGYTELLTAREYNIAIGLYLLFGMAIAGIFTYGAGDVAAPLMEVHPLAFAIIYIVVMMGVSALAAGTNNGVLASGFYLLMCATTGVLLSTYVPDIAMNIVLAAFTGTVGILLIMTLMAGMFPQTFQSLGRTLLANLLCSIVVELVMLLFGLSTGFMDFIVLGIFSLYIGFDWVKGQERDATLQGAVLTSIELYMDLLNIFVRLLSIMGKSKKN